MTGKVICQIHRYKKRGYCSSCQVCNCCQPGPACSTITSHHSWFTEQKKKRKITARKRKYNLLSQEQNPEIDQLEQYAIDITNVEKLSKILQLLGNYTNEVEHIPKNGYDGNEIDINNKTGNTTEPNKLSC